MKHASSHDFLAHVAQNNPGQPEYLQAVTEVVESLWPFIAAHPRYAEQGLLDRLFIRNAPDDSDAQAIAKAMIVMAHGLGLHVVAEGVETPAQCRFLLEQGCDEVQGHLYSPPLPGDEVPALMARRTTDVHGGAPT